MFNYIKKIKIENKLNYYITLTASIIGIIIGLITLVEHLSNDEMKMTGNWEVEFITEESSYNPYIGMSLTYKLYFSQINNEFDAIGETWFVDGKQLPSSRHRKLTLKGTINKKNINGRYTLVGKLRESYGSINAKVSNDGLSFKGDFEGTAANTTGKVIGTLKR